MPYFYDEKDIQSVRDGNDIVEVISEYVQLKRAGQNYKGLCPFHSEKTPSFVVSPDKQIFHCFGCGAGGDVVSFISKYKNLDFKESIEELAKRANIDISKDRKMAPAENKDEKLILYEINREAAIYFYKNLKENKYAFDYLLKRGIDKDTIKRYGIGYSSEKWDGLLNYLLVKKYKLEDIEKAGLISKSKDGKRYYDRFRGRIIFPIWDVRSKVIGFGGRIVHDGGNAPKYLNSPDTDIFLKGKHLYGLNIAKEEIRSSRAVLVEGYMDVVSLYQNGIRNSVASLGTALTHEQVKLIKRHTNDIIIAYDSDSAGINATMKAIDIIRAEGLIPRVLEIDEGLDPDELIKKYGPREFKKKTDDAIHYIDFIIKANKRKYDLDDIGNKLKFIQEIAYVLKSIESPVELELYINRISEEIGISSESILREVKGQKTEKRFKKKSVSQEDVLSFKSQKEDSLKSIESKILNLIMEEPAILKNITSELGPDDFTDQVNKGIFNYMVAAYESQGEKLILDISSIGEEYKSRVEEIEELILNIEADKRNKAVQDFIDKIKMSKLEIERNKVLESLRKVEIDMKEDRSKIDEFKSLCKELDSINRNLKLL